MGRLTREPELRQTPNGVAVASFSIAVNRRFAKEGQQNADFIECTAWRQQAEFICRYFKKGSMIALTGSIQTGSYEKDGVKKYTTEVVVDEVYFTGEKASGAQQGGYSQPAPPQIDNDNPFEGLEENDDDLPF